MMNEDAADAASQAMRDSYGDFIDQTGLLSLDLEHVPRNLVAYLPYAALWGVADDLDREQQVNAAPPAAKADLVRVVQLIEDDLDDWLAGDEAHSSVPSKEYVAFSAMRMAADFV